MADDNSVPNVGDIPADSKSDAKAAKASVVLTKDANGKDTPMLDFLSAPEAEAQAKALGKGASVEHIGVAYHVNVKE